MTFEPVLRPQAEGCPGDFAALLSFVETTPLLDARQRRETLSAINSVAVWLKLPLARIPTAPAALRRHLAGLNSAAIGVSRGRLANVRALLNRALTLAKVKPSNRPVAEVLTPAWRALFEALENRYWRTSLAPFARFCAMAKIEPEAVTDDASRAYLVHLEQTALVKKPATTHQTMARTWNRSRESVPGWPDVVLAVPRYAERYTLPLASFPASFQAEVEAYLGRLGCQASDDLLDENAPPRALRPGSIRTKRYEIRAFASALVITGTPKDQINSLSALTTPEAFKEGLRFFLGRQRRDPESTRTAGQIAHTIRSIAKYFVQLPKAELTALDAITARLNRRIPGMTEKNRDRLAQFDDESLLRQFLRLPPTEIAKLRRAGIHTRHNAVAFSLLVALEILIHAPMRVSNLAALRIDQHMRLPRSGKGESVILLPRNLVKNAEPVQYLLPAEVTSLVTEYLDRVKPMLETQPSPFVFPGEPDRPKRADTLSRQLSALVWERLGIRFNAHLMRHLAAKLHLDSRPGDYEAPRRLLGNRSLDVVYEAYSGMETKSASRLHDELIRRKRGELEHARYPRRRLQAGVKGSSSAGDR